MAERQTMRGASSPAMLLKKQPKKLLRKQFLAVVVFCLVLQPLFATSVSAMEPEAPQLPITDSTNDILPPTVPTEGAPHDETKLTTDFSFTWQPSTDVQSNVTYTLRASRDPAQVGTAPETSSAWYSPALTDPTLLASSVNWLDGVWYWQVRAVDGAGNKSTWSAVWNVTIDTYAPAIAVVRPTEGELMGTGTTQLEAIITEENLASSSVELDGMDITAQVQAAYEGAGMRLTAMWPPGELGDGAHTVRVRAADTFGHVNEVNRTFTIDTTAPEIMSSLAENQKLRGIVSITLDANEAHPGLYAIEIASSDGEVVVQAEGDVQAEGANSVTRTWNTLENSDGTYRVTFIGRDSVGNETVLVRSVVVANAAGGMGGIIIKDPLLEELSLSLSQPLNTPQVVEPRALPVALPDISDIEAQPYDELLENVPQFAAVAATEDGWRLFGILWYWWILGGGLLAAGGSYTWRLARQDPQQITS